MQTITMTSIAQQQSNDTDRLTRKAERLDQLIRQANAEGDAVMAQGYLAELSDVMRSLRRIARGW